VDESLEDVRNIEKAPKPRAWKLWEVCGYPIIGKRRRGKDHRRGSHLKTNVLK
jgi:hypothetical protein